MKDANLNTDYQESVQGLIDPVYDPVYGPTSTHFWPGSWIHAENYVLSPTHSPDYVSGEEFLETYEDRFSGVSDYIESTDYPKRSYSDTLYHHFHRLYGHLESWDASTLFVSAVYRGLFHEMRPYESRLLELRTRLNYEAIWENYLKKGRKDEALATYAPFVKEEGKRERNLSVNACARLLNLMFYPYTDLSLISELIKVLHRTKIAANHQQEFQEGLLSELGISHTLTLLEDESRRDLHRERFLLALSLLQIEAKAAERAVDESLSLQSYEPMIRLIPDLPSSTSKFCPEKSDGARKKLIIDSILGLTSLIACAVLREVRVWV
jgi:hypothetical protein